MKAGDCNISERSDAVVSEKFRLCNQFSSSRRPRCRLYPPLPRMWFSGPIQYKHGELVGGSLVVRLPQARPRARFRWGKDTRRRGDGFSHDKDNYLFMSLCSALIGHRGSVTKVPHVDKNLCVAAKSKARVYSRMLVKIKRSCSPARGPGPASRCQNPRSGSGSGSGSGYHARSFVLLLGFVLCELLKKNPPPQWKCSLPKLVLFTRSRG